MRRSPGVLLVALAAVLLVGCSGAGSEVGGADSGGAGSVVGADAVGPEQGTPGAPADAETERQVVTTAAASLTVDDPAEGAQQVSELVESAGGRVEERSEQTADEDTGLRSAVADLVVRVPADALTDLLADLAGLGEVRSVSVSRSDQTGTAVDLDARISALQTSVARLEGLLAGAATTGALLEAEAALSDRQGQLESLQSQRALLADQVELSTLSVHLQTVEAAPDGGPDGFLEGLGTGWRALVSALGVGVVVLGVLLPWLVVAAIVTGVVLVVLRRRVSRSTPAPGPEHVPARPEERHSP